MATLDKELCTEFNNMSALMSDRLLGNLQTWGGRQEVSRTEEGGRWVWCTRGVSLTDMMTVSASSTCIRMASLFSLTSSTVPLSSPCAKGATSPSRVEGESCKPQQKLGTRGEEVGGEGRAVIAVQINGLAQG